MRLRRIGKIFAIWRCLTGWAASKGVLVRTGAVFLVAASVLALAPPTAAAQEASVQNRARPEYDPLGMRLGAFMLNASVDLGLASTDNVFAEETSPESDIIFSVAPNAILASGWSRHQLVLSAGSVTSSYEDNSSEDASSYYGRADGRVDIGSRTFISPTVGFAHIIEPRTDPDAPIVGDPVEYDRTDVGVSVEHNFNRVSVLGGVSFLDVDYDTAGQDFRDFTEDGVRGRVEVEFTPRLSGVFEVRHYERDYDLPVSADSDGEEYLAGLRLNLTDLLTGEVLLGQYERSYDDGVSTDGVAIDANLIWYVTRLTNVTFYGRRSGEDVTGTTASPYTEQNFGARVDHELLRNVLLTGAVSTGELDFEVLDRTDERLSASVGAEYLLNRRVAFTGGYSYDEIQSDGADRYRDYEVNVFRVGVRFQL